MLILYRQTGVSRKWLVNKDRTNNENDCKLCAVEVSSPERIKREVAQKATELQQHWCFAFRCYLPSKESIFQQVGKHLRKWRHKIWFSQGHTMNQRFRNRKPHLQPPDVLPRQCSPLTLLKHCFCMTHLYSCHWERLILLKPEPTGLPVTLRGVLHTAVLRLVCCTLWSETLLHKLNSHPSGGSP